MLPITQALAEYVTLTASSVRAFMGTAVRNVVRFGSDHFVVVIAILALLVLGIMLRSGSRR